MEIEKPLDSLSLVRRTHFPFDPYPGKFKSVLCVIMIVCSSPHHMGKGFAAGYGEH